MASTRRTVSLTLGVAVGAFLAGTYVNQRAVDAQSRNRVFELRTYTTTDGKLEQLVKRHRDGAIPLFKKHGMSLVGFWIPADPPRSANTLTYILAHASRESAEAGWKAFLDDPGRNEFEHEPIVKNVERVFLNPADFSPIK